MQYPTVTAAIPTFKRPTQFRRALESVLAQTVSPEWIIVGDDGADQEIRDICASYGDTRILYVPRQSKVRMTENWDFVMRWASEGFVALLEDDNIWNPNHIENAVTLFHRFPEAGICHAGHQEAWDSGGQLRIYKTFFPPWHRDLEARAGGLVSTQDIVFDALLCGSINSSTVVVRRVILDSVPRFDPRYLMGMDTLMWTRIAIAAPCIYAPSLDTIYTYHGRNVSAGEMATRRAGYQVRASRRIIAAEALAIGILTPDSIRTWLTQLPPPDAAGVLTIFAHPEADSRLRRIANDVWKTRPEVRHTSGYLRASRIFGFRVLEQADRIDPALGDLMRIKARL